MIADAKRPLTKAETRKLRKKEKESFKRAHRAEKSYAKALKSVGRQIGDIIKAFAPKGMVRDLSGLTASLDKYAQLLRPWAVATAESLIRDISKRDEKSWTELSRYLGRELEKEIRTAPTGAAMNQILQEQVDLITSLPLRASQRIHKLTVEGLAGGPRAEEIRDEILKSGQVSVSQATTIARTETTRTATAMTQARALHIGSEGYIWRTAEDGDVRPQHKRLNGRFFRWDDPPVAGSNGERAHAGAIYNCRCYPEPVIPADI